MMSGDFALTREAFCLDLSLHYGLGGQLLLVLAHTHNTVISITANHLISEAKRAPSTGIRTTTVCWKNLPYLLVQVDLTLLEPRIYFSKINFRQPRLAVLIKCGCDLWPSTHIRGDLVEGQQADPQPQPMIEKKGEHPKAITDGPLPKPMCQRASISPTLLDPTQYIPLEGA